jgi:hypothetical protein
MGLKNAACTATAVGVTLLVTGWSVAVGVAGADPTTPAPAPPAPGPAAPGTDPAAAPAAPAGAPTALSTDGIFVVGKDIAPGTYASAGPVGDGACYWKRMDADGKIIDNAMSKKPQVVQIDATDAKFKTSGCQPWGLTDQAPPPSGPTGILGALQLGSMLNDLNNRAAQAPPTP